jgi:hypothetical protein
MGAADLIFSQFGIWSVNSSTHNVYLLVFYFAACVVQTTFMVRTQSWDRSVGQAFRISDNSAQSPHTCLSQAVIFTIRMLGIPWKSWISLAPWQAEMDFVLVCVGFFVYVRLFLARWFSSISVRHSLSIITRIHVRRRAGSQTLDFVHGVFLSVIWWWSPQLLAATLACLTLMAASADEMGRQAAWDRGAFTARVLLRDAVHLFIISM